MKKIMFFSIIPILLILLFILMYDNKKKESNKLITISSVNSYIYNEETLIDIPFYVNNNNLNYENINIYNDFYLKNENETTVIELELKEVTYSHNERYQNNTYFKYHLKFIMPNIASTININDAFLKFNFANNEKKVLNIGSFNIIKLTGERELEEISNMYAVRDSNEVIINEIILEDFKLKNISNIHVGDFNYLNYNIINNNLKIEINKDSLYIVSVPIFIEVNNVTYYINNFKFLDDYELLNSNTNLLNVYELN